MIQVCNELKAMQASGDSGKPKARDSSGGDVVLLPSDRDDEHPASGAYSIAKKPTLVKRTIVRKKKESTYTSRSFFFFYLF